MNHVKPYSSEGSKKEQVASMFDAISERYDVLNRTLSLGIDVIWRKITIAAVRKTGAKKILDVATGTADLAIALHRGIQGSQVEGIDISAGMLEVGRKKITRRGLDPHLPLHLGDGEALPFEAATFDAVTVAFGVRNFEHLEKGLVDMRRVLRPGGHLAVLEFSQPESFPFRQIYFFYFKHILPSIGKWLSKDSAAYTYLPASVEAFPYGEAFSAKLKAAGFSHVTIRPLTFGIASLYLAHTELPS
ncbi:MAG: bifunctional demethylmenaquinone methyltransferase/2-methoxy-6-polyprenyl-1,4-benzoquinol methylase UbiE [Schleiferiaceae bacterium]|nr:bifunctional demethylmenaquinone methyltransferase/2-methoxy-6-polyprenyl-1,4-benzoquinol methylase UbiE [Schleiferiaceae bacterium]